MDTTTATMLSDLLAELRRRDVELFIARLHYPARVVLERARFTESLGAGHVWHSISQTVKAAELFIAGRPLPAVEDAVEWDLEPGARHDGQRPDGGRPHP